MTRLIRLFPRIFALIICLLSVSASKGQFGLDEKLNANFEINGAAPIGDKYTLAKGTPYQMIDKTVNLCGEFFYTWSVSPNYPTTAYSISDPTVYEPTITFNAPGTYMLTLLVDAKGGPGYHCAPAWHEKTVKIVIPDAPSAMFSMNGQMDYINISKGQTVVFKDLSLNNPTSWQWNVSGPSGWSIVSGSLNSKDMAVSFPEGGGYGISLTATGAAGSSTYGSTVNVQNAGPISRFTANGSTADSIFIQPNQTVSFLDQSTGNPTNWFWNVLHRPTVNNGQIYVSGDPYSRNPQVKFPVPGIYSVTLYASNSAGGNVRQVLVFVEPPPPGVQDVKLCKDKPASPLTAIKSAIPGTLRWYTSPEFGSWSYQAPVPSTSQTGTTDYYVSEIVFMNLESKRAKITVTVGNPPSAPLVSSSRTYCQGAGAPRLTATGTNLLWYTQPGPGFAPLPEAPVPSTAVAGTMTYYVSQTNENGCESPKASITVTVTPSSPNPIVTPVINYDLNASTTPLQAIGSNLLWYTSDTARVGSVTAPTPNSSVPGVTYYYVTQSVPGRCQSPKAIITVRVNVPVVLYHPVINSFSPMSASVGTNVVISGTNFSSKTDSNIVFFGATKAQVINASSTSLTVRVPAGTTYAPVTVINAGPGFIGSSRDYFLPTFSPAKDSITTSDMDYALNFDAGIGPYAVTIGDIDGDGRPDLVTPSQQGSFSVLLNSSTPGNIAFSARREFATGGNSRSVAIGDLDGDGKQDVAIANYGSPGMVAVFRNTGGPGNISFAPAVNFHTGPGTAFVTISDINKDGKQDLVTANQNNHTVSILPNVGTPGHIYFAPRTDLPTGLGPRSVAVADLDGDGKPDIVTANSVNSVSVLRNNSRVDSIAFQPKIDHVTSAGNFTVMPGDIDGDGKPDLVVSSVSTFVSVLKNFSSTGNIVFSNSTFPAAGRGIAIGDINGDGKPDLATSGGFNTISVLQKDTATRYISFAPRVNFQGDRQPLSMAIGDIDGDGKPDLVAANLASNTISILRNNPQYSLPPVARITPSGPVKFCASESVTLSADSAYSYQWYLNGSAIPGSTSKTLLVYQSGAYTLSVTNSSGQSDTSAVTVVSVEALPVPSIAVSRTDNTFTGLDSTTIALGYGAQSLILTASTANGGVNNYLWTAGSENPDQTVLSSTTVNNPVFTPALAGIYTFTVAVTNENGCTATTTVSLTVLAASTSKNPDQIALCIDGKQKTVNKHAVPAQLKKGGSLGACLLQKSNKVMFSAQGGPDLVIPAAKTSSLEIYPNPFSDKTTVDFNIGEPNQNVALDIYNSLGIKVKTLYRGTVEAGKVYSFSVSGLNLPAGNYLFRLATNAKVLNVKGIKVN
ncbi:FG-GAP-like repeat-containing protein [Paradesertivirga mongoliensis]|uniref:FG-GAP-like repeat-containing protein n=1 Tax=Paradesertivirga mongoliensis TaxID=2100740 RepID=A0ABW4ZM21_9SPHI|nr:FG-GAP-like repeat-containing protein [Pedobacter mongoliensis]